MECRTAGSLTCCAHFCLISISMTCKLYVMLRISLISQVQSFSLISRVRSTPFWVVKTKEKMLYRSTWYLPVSKCPNKWNFELNRHWDEVFGVIEYLNFMTRFRVRTFQFSSGIPQFFFSSHILWLNELHWKEGFKRMQEADILYCIEINRLHNCQQRPSTFAISVITSFLYVISPFYVVLYVFC